MTLNLVWSFLSFAFMVTGSMWITVALFLHFIWQHPGDNIWQHCDHGSEWKDHTQLDKPSHPHDLEAGPGLSPTSSWGCSLPGRRLSSQWYQSVHPHRSLQVHVHNASASSCCLSAGKHVTNWHEWESKQWPGHVLWSRCGWIYEWRGYPWEKSQGRWHQQWVSAPGPALQQNYGKMKSRLLRCTGYKKST